MKKLRLYVIFLAATALLFTFCSKEDDHALSGDEKAILSFGAVLNDLVNSKSELKQQLEIPACSDDAPAFVDIVLSGTTEVGSIKDPLRLTVNATPADYNGDGFDDYFTNEHSDLELEPGSYTLEWFVVRNANLEIIWIAPMGGGNMANLVNNPLPFNFNLSAGAKQYVDVDVLCYDERELSSYGYSFFNINTHRFFKYCFYVNLVDENGRHFPASYSIDIRLNNGSSYELIYSDVINNTGINSEGDAFAEPVCFALPDLPEYADDEDYLSYNVEVLDWPEVYGAVPSMLCYRTFSRNDITSNFEGATGPAYNHLKFQLPPVVGQEKFGGIVAYVGDFYTLVVPPEDLLPSGWDTAWENIQNLSLNGYDDWDLPSRDELINIIEFINPSGTKYYWSSWTLSSTEAVAVKYSEFASEYPDDWRYWTLPFSRDEVLNVRPIRRVFPVHCYN